MSNNMKIRFFSPKNSIFTHCHYNLELISCHRVLEREKRRN